MSERPYVIGLTGNIATGKSVVARMLGERGAEFIDADRLAHQVIARGTPAWERIVEAFGFDVLKPNGDVDRRKLGEIVFSNLEALARLEGIVHPDVILYTEQLITICKASVVVVEAIKLIESGMADRLCDTLWVVTAPRAAQIERLVRERGLEPREAALRVDAQPAQERKIARADVTIDNGGTLDQTECQVKEAWLNVVQAGPARMPSAHQ